MKRKKYIAPQTDVSEVELESGFMSASVVDKEAIDPNDPVDAGDQAINDNFDFTGNKWQEN